MATKPVKLVDRPTEELVEVPGFNRPPERIEGDYMSPDSPDWLALTPEEKKKRLQLLRMPPPGQAPRVDKNTDYRDIKPSMEK